jgi:NAD(P)-dependent dehydrogenase (short-subunit alcohol dehydrogenase family)
LLVQTAVTDEEQVSRLFRRTMEQFGRLDVVVRVSSEVAIRELSVEA